LLTPCSFKTTTSPSRIALSMPWPSGRRSVFMRAQSLPARVCSVRVARAEPGQHAVAVELDFVG